MKRTNLIKMLWAKAHIIEDDNDGVKLIVVTAQGKTRKGRTRGEAITRLADALQEEEWTKFCTGRVQAAE